MAWYTDDLEAAKKEAARLGVGVAALPKTTWQQWYAVLEGGPCGNCPEKKLMPHTVFTTATALSGNISTRRWLSCTKLICLRALSLLR